MNKFLVATLILFIVPNNEVRAQKNSDKDKESQHYEHNLRLSDWGPYTKKYIGVSHIPDTHKGIRFDLSVFPGFYRRKVEIPNVFFESGFHPWQATSNLEFFTYRHELEWKDKVYSDISYFKLKDEESRLIRMEMVKSTDLNQSLVMNFMASIHFPSIKAYRSDTPIEIAEVDTPKNTN